MPVRQRARIIMELCGLFKVAVDEIKREHKQQ